MKLNEIDEVGRAWIAIAIILALLWWAFAELIDAGLKSWFQWG